VDAAGTLTRDVELTERDSLQTDCNFTLATEDTSAPRLLTADAPDSRHLVLKFNEQLDTSGISAAMFSIGDTLTQRRLGVKHAFVTDPSQPLSVTLQTDTQEKDAGYRVSVDGVVDNSAHPISALAHTLPFRGSGVPDTTAPRLLTATLRDTTKAVFPDEDFRFDFSDALTPAIEHAFTFTAADSVAVPFTLRYSSCAGVVLKPGKDLLPKTRYVVRLHMDSVRNLSGKILKDSVRVFRYITIDPDAYCSIDGMVINPLFSDTSTVIAEAVNILVKQANVQRTVVRKDRSFSFPMLSEGMYGVRVFGDVNKNGVLDAGRVFPFLKSEPFVVGRDTIKVRARWPVEGVIVR
jgi:hypothetical protein